MTSVAAQQPTHIITPSSIELTESFLIDSVSPKLGYSPHKWQAHIARTLLLRKNRIIVSVAATGSGKSLTFWLPILAGEPGITFIVVPLTVLGQQMADSAGGLGISAFNATSITMRSEYAIKDISTGRYQVIAISPELLIDARFWDLFRSPIFRKFISRIIVDEAHCVSFKTTWVQWYLTSATLNIHSVSNLLNILGMPPIILKASAPPTATHLIQRSNDRPNLHYAVRQMKHSASSFKDLAFLVSEAFATAAGSTPQTIIYVNSRSDAESLMEALETFALGRLAGAIVYVHAGMSEPHRVETAQGFKAKKLTIIIATEALGLGIDMRNVAVVIQFGLCDSVDTLAQRFGRAGRDPSSPALCLLLAPPKLFIEVREKKERAAAKRKKKTIESPAAAQNGDKQMVPTTAPEALHSDDEGDEPGEEYVPVAMAVLNDKNQPRGGKRKRAIARDLNPELDAFINAASLSVEDERFNCRRRVLQIHYGTDSIPMPRTCCALCDLRDPSNGCCDLCTPSIVAALFKNVPTPAPSPRNSSGTKTKDYSMNDTDLKLRDLLRNWRFQKLKEQDGGRSLSGDLLDGRSLMPNDIVLRLVALAHHGLINTRETLIRDVMWPWIDTYADELLIIAHSTHPPPPPPPPPPPVPPPHLSPLTIAVDSLHLSYMASSAARVPIAPVGAVPKRQQHCRGCGGTGHNKRTCPSPKVLRPNAGATGTSATSSVDKENTPLPHTL